MVRNRSVGLAGVLAVLAGLLGSGYAAAAQGDPAGRSIATAAEMFRQDWKYAVFGSGIGLSGLITEDIDDDGQVEIVCGGSFSTFGANDFWYVLDYVPATTEYRMTWISTPYPDGISSLAAFDYNGDGKQEIFVGLENGEVYVHNGQTKEHLTVLTSDGDPVNRIQLADADNDGAPEIVFCDDSSTFVYSADSFSLENEIPYGASDFEVGQVDADAYDEIVLANGVILQLVGANLAVEWIYPGRDFGYRVELSDIDADGMAEIIGASSWYYVTTFDADVQSPKWQINADLDVDALLMADVNGDGVEELLYGDGQWGQVHCYDPVTVTEIWQVDNPLSGVTHIAVADTDGDGGLELMWGAGAHSTGKDQLYVHSIPSLAAEWESQHLDGPFFALDVGDVDSDGRQEIAFASFESDSGYADGVVAIYDAATYRLEWQSGTTIFGGSAWTGVHDLIIHDVDDDGSQEIVVGTDRVYDGAIYVLNGVSHEIEASFFLDEGAPIHSLAAADVDNDGRTEIIAGGGREHTGAPGVYVYVIDGTTGAIEWHSISLGAYWSSMDALEVGNVDSDAALELVAVNDHLFIMDAVSHIQWESMTGGHKGLDLHDVDGDGIEEIVVGNAAGEITALDGQTHEERFAVATGDSAVEGLRVFDVRRDGQLDLIYASAETLKVYNLSSGSLLWESGPLGPVAGRYNSLFVTEADPGAARIGVGSDYAVTVFKDTVPAFWGAPASMAGAKYGPVSSIVNCAAILLVPAAVLLWIRGRRTAASAAASAVRGPS
ncbi:MAG: VCBS repeat-containing protein [bacterium]